MEKIHVLLVEDEQTLAMIIKAHWKNRILSLLPPEMVKKA